jgi:ATP-dependent Clp protease ATP-binding subunit ClpA
VLFGRLKNGGAVRVVVVADDGGKPVLGFEYPEGPITPRPERDVTQAGRKKPKRKPRVYVKRTKPKSGPNGNGRGGVRTVPKVPLVRA